MNILGIFKQRASFLVLAVIALAVAGNEWRQYKGVSMIPTASAASVGSNASKVLCEGRVATYPGAKVTLGAEVAGRLSKLDVKERDVVKRGDLIASVDVKEQRAALYEARARVKEADADVDYLGRERDRSERLLAESAVPQAAFDKSSHDANAADRHKAAMAASTARIDAILEKANVVAPIDGTILLRSAEAGEMVAVGTPLVTIADLSRLRIEAEVGEFDTSRVRIGAPVSIRAEGYDGAVWPGVIEEIPDAVFARQLKPLDPSRPIDTRVLLVKIKLTEPTPLKLGQRVEVEIGR